MKLTEALIEQYIDEAKIIISRCYPSFVPPTIVKITISRARSYWAQIKHVNGNCYELRVSNVFNEIADEYLFHKRLMSCMIHELIHTMPKCWNHGTMFKRMAALINRYYPEFDVQTGTVGEAFGIKEDVRVIRYVVKCANCGAESKYVRKPKIWQYINKKNSPYTCCRCGRSKFVGIKFD